MPLLALFGAAELSTAAYGLFSLRLFHEVGHYTAGISLFGTTAISFTLLLIPTMLMGSTLPMLVAYSVRRSRNVGGSLGLLYFVNTLGSAFACFLAAAVLMARLGQSGSVAAGAAINATVGIGALAIYYLRRAEPVRSTAADSSVAADAAHDEPATVLSLPVAAIFVGDRALLRWLTKSCGTGCFRSGRAPTPESSHSCWEPTWRASQWAV